MVTPTPTTVQVKMQLRGDTAANWASVNPVLLAREVGLETDTKKVKVGDGTTAWNSLAYFPSIVSGGTVLGNLEIGTTGTLTFEGSTADGFETTLAVTDPTADRTITLPDQSGTVVVTGNASIVDADIAANAEIAVSKLANGTANQVIVTDGTNVSWSDDLTLAGNLTVNGTTTTVNTETLVVKDKNIEMGVVGTPTDLTADGGGITLKGTTDKTINWIDATDAWTSSERFSVPLGSAASPSLTFTGDENTGIYSPGADQLAISTNGTGRLFVDASGNVGIGGSPTAKLDVRGTLRVEDQATSPSIFLRDTDAAGDAQITQRNSGDLAIINGATTRSTIFETGGSERLRITSDGKLGLGTSVPVSPCHIEGVEGAAQLTISNTNLAASDGDFLAGIDFLIRDNDDATGAVCTSIRSIADQNHTLISKGTALAFSTTPDDTTTLTERLRIDSSGRLLVGTDTALNASMTAIIKGSSGGAGLMLARAIIPSSGSSLATVYMSDHLGGIGAWIDAARDGGTWTSGSSHPTLLRFATTADGASSPTEKLRITSAGLVGIGTSTPDRILDIESAGSAEIKLTDSTNIGRDAYIKNNDGDFEFRSRDRNSNGAFVFLGYGGEIDSEYARFDSSGRLLVGTSSALRTTIGRTIQSASTAGAYLALGRDESDPTANSAVASFEGYVKSGSTYAVAGSVAFETDGAVSSGDYPTRLVFSTTSDGASSPTERLRITSAGRVGIGTSSPSAVLTVDPKPGNFTSTYNNYDGVGLFIRGNGTSGNGNYGPALVFGSCDSDTLNQENKHCAISLVQTGTDPNATGLAFWTHPSTTSTDALEEKVRIDSSGRVGIGTTAPGAELHVSPGAGNVGNIYLDYGTGSSTDGRLNIEVTSSTVNYETVKTGGLAQVWYVTGGEAMRIDAARRLLVGTSSAVTGGTSQFSRIVALGNSAGATNPGVISVGMGATPASGNNIGRIFFVDNAAGEYAEIAAQCDGTPGSGDYPGRLVFSTTDDGASSPTERMRISGNGRTSLRQAAAASSATASALLTAGSSSVTGSVGWESYATITTTRYHASFSVSGSVVGSISTSGSSTAYNTSSDYRLKENIVPLTGAADRLNQLQVHRFNFIADPDKTVNGFIAHEAQAIVPEAVHGTKDEVDDDGNPVYQGIDQSKLVPLLTAALQEALQKIETLEQRLSDAGIA